MLIFLYILYFRYTSLPSTDIALMRWPSQFGITPEVVPLGTPWNSLCSILDAAPLYTPTPAIPCRILCISELWVACSSLNIPRCSHLYNFACYSLYRECPSLSCLMTISFKHLKSAGLKLLSKAFPHLYRWHSFVFWATLSPGDTSIGELIPWFWNDLCA